MGCPIRISTAIAAIGTSPWLFAANHVLPPLFYPRHPLLALKKIISNTKFYLAMQYNILLMSAKYKQPFFKVAGTKITISESIARDFCTFFRLFLCE